MSEVFDGLKRTVKHFQDDFIPDTHCEICGKKLWWGLCKDCDQP